MTTIIAGQPAQFTLTVQRDGAAVAIEPDSDVTATLFASNGITPLSTPASLAAVPGWATGAVDVALDGAATSVAAGEVILALVSTKPAIVKRFRVVVETAGSFERSKLFVKDIAVDRLRSDGLIMAARGAMPSVPMSDDYLWDKLRAAESEMAHELRVPLVPTAFFPEQPTADQITALNGMPWGIDPGYDYEPNAFQYNDKWGMLKMRQKPLKSVSRVRFAYPGGNGSHYDLPLDWLRMEKKYGLVQFVPSSTAFIAPLNSFVMQAIGSGRSIPLAIQFTYVAGLDDVPANFPELLDAIYKTAALKIIEDAFLPQSGSISADGLSQSISTDMDKHRDTIDRIINGGKGSNGGLFAAIHGIRVGVMG